MQPVPQPAEALGVFSGLAQLVAQSWPVVAAGAVGAAVPRRESRNERLWVGLCAAFGTLMIMMLWPSIVPATAEAIDVKAVYPHLLSWLVFLPFVGALAVLFVPRQSKGLLQRTTMVVLGLELLISLLLLRLPRPEGTFWLEENIAWIPSFGINYHLAVDGISLWLVILSGALTPIAVYASFGSIHTRLKDYCFAFLVLQGAMIGSLLAIDLFLFYVMWELMLIPMYILIGVWGGADRIYAAVKFFIYTMTGSMLLLAAILYVVWQYRMLNGGQPSFDMVELQRLQLPLDVQMWLFAGFSIAFLIKVPMFPVHTWLPDAHTQAPTGGSVVLAAVMLKVGSYAYLRFCMGLFPHAAHRAGATLAGIAVVGGILYGALCAFKQQDVKRLVAYSSVSHLGYVMLGIFAATTASVEGSILQMVNHGISTGALFLLVGIIYDRRHTRDVAEFGGLAAVMPWYSAAFVIVTLSSVGLPGTNGFVGEWLIISGTFLSAGTLGQYNRLQAIGAAVGVILSALYMLTVTQKMFFGPVKNPKNKGLPDLTRREVAVLAPLIVLIFAIGLFPRIITEPMHPTVAAFVGDYRARFRVPAPDHPILKPQPAQPTSK